MFKISFITVLCILISFSALYPQNRGDVLLYSQTGDFGSDHIFIPSDIWTVPNTWHQAADDFTADSGWTIDQIVVAGSQIDTNYISGFTIKIYGDNNTRPGASIYTAENQPYSASLLLPDSVWKCTIALETPVMLNSGYYWISVQAYSDFATWGWSQMYGSFGSIAYYHDFTPYCSEWDVLWHCHPTAYTDMYFELYGNSSTPVDLTSFTASARDGAVNLTWSTSTESNNKGFEIERLNTGLGAGRWNEIAFIPGSGTTTETKFYAYTNKNLAPGTYLYRLKQIDFDGRAKYSDETGASIGIPRQFSLGQNFPNPFNPATTISYELPRSGFVTLRIYDILGREAAVLVNERKQAGRYLVNFDAGKSGLSGGVYIYQLRVDDYESSKKMLLLN